MASWGKWVWSRGECICAWVLTCSCYHITKENLPKKKDFLPTLLLLWVEPCSEEVWFVVEKMVHTVFAVIKKVKGGCGHQ